MNKKREIKKLKISIEKMQDEIWELKNPFKFEIADSVYLKCAPTAYGIIKSYKVIERYFEHFHNVIPIDNMKIYRLIDCDTCMIFKDTEENLELMKESDIK